MRSGSQEEECELRVILLPRHQPVGLDVALPDAVHVARQLVGAVLGRQRTGSFEQIHRIGNELHVKTSLDATAELLLETGGKYNLISNL